ncbi:MAG: hypothetical protein JXJ17_18515, partial [Anaerolineae bacterium]|nr:hypothetical protein [Anaerolineae bacterium]
LHADALRAVVDHEDVFFSHLDSAALVSTPTLRRFAGIVKLEGVAQVICRCYDYSQVGQNL